MVGTCPYKSGVRSRVVVVATAENNCNTRRSHSTACWHGKATCRHATYTNHTAPRISNDASRKWMPPQANLPPSSTATRAVASMGHCIQSYSNKHKPSSILLTGWLDKLLKSFNHIRPILASLPKLDHDVIVRNTQGFTVDFAGRQFSLSQS